MKFICQEKPLLDHLEFVNPDAPEIADLFFADGRIARNRFDGLIEISNLIPMKALLLSLEKRRLANDEAYSASPKT